LPEFNSTTESNPKKSPPDKILHPQQLTISRSHGSEEVFRSSDLSFFEYEALGDDPNLPPLEKERAIKACEGKRYEWFAYVHTISEPALSEDSHFSVGLSSHDHSISAICARLPRSSEITVKRLTIGQPIKILGVLKDQTSILAENIDEIEQSAITMKDFAALLKQGTSIRDVSQQHIGKHVDWLGYLHSWEVYSDRDDFRFRLSLVADMDNIDEYIYCYLSKEAESAIGDFVKGSPIHVTGILTGRTELKLMSLEGRNEGETFDAPVAPEAIGDPAFLRFISEHANTSGTVLTVQNIGTVNLPIRRASYTISDPAILQKIEAKHPKGPTEYGNSNNMDDVIFEEGAWLEDGRYEFSKDLEYHIPAGSPNSFLLGIANDKLAGLELKGTIAFEVVGKVTKSITYLGIEIKAKPVKEYQDKLKQL
jgi:hypothetical protein